jgi:hypothetical protein
MRPYILMLSIGACIATSSCAQRSDPVKTYVGDGSVVASCQDAAHYVVRWPDLQIDASRAVVQESRITSASVLPHAMMGLRVSTGHVDATTLPAVTVNLGVLKLPGNQDSDLVYFAGGILTDAQWNRICIDGRIEHILVFASPPRHFQVRAETQYQVHLNIAPSQQTAPANTLSASLVLFDASELLGADERQ